MKRRFRPFLGLMLAAILALTGQSMAVARGMSDVAGHIVLCTGTGPVTVLVDGNGQPVGPSHICPDCALSHFALAGTMPQVVARPLGKGIRLRPDGAARAISSVGPVARARGPPADAL
ncbi:MAG: hypothetical protein HLUCCO07_15100 [Rhodobacteraceae bacterium HLUCCO07]|nr:MAG: hypothetical protein HLUCCO07_15100 [Rhodobacteraceae bacterium HLUCCO07]